MAWWVAALVYIVGTVLYDVLRPKTRFDEPSPSSLGDFNFPTIGEGRAVPLVWGTCKLAAPAVTWTGDLRAEPIKKWVRTGLFSGEHVTTGYRYSLQMQLVLCTGVLDDVVEIRWDDQVAEPAAKYPETHAVNFIYYLPKFFGGDEEEGGIQGAVTVFRGTASQPPALPVAGFPGVDVPAYRGVAYAMFYGTLSDKGFTFGDSAYIKPISIVVRRTPNGLTLTGGAENIGGDANPANMIFDILTSPHSLSGLGLPAGALDLPSWRAVGQTLATEGLGLSMIQDRSVPARDLILEILKHIDGMIYVEPTTGLLVLRLVRFDYDVEDLPVLDNGNATVMSFSRPSWSEIKNTVRVSYVDRAENFIEKITQAQELAAIAIQGGEVSVQDLQFRGLSTAANAQKAAARALIALGYALASVTLEVDRAAWTLRPGGVFILDWPALGIEGLVCRVVRIATGRLDAGKITVEAMEDIFAVSWAAYTAPPASGWEDPAGGVVPNLSAAVAFAAPWPAVENLTPGPSITARGVLAVAPGVGNTTGWNAILERKYEHSSGWSLPYPQTVFTPMGTLAADITETTATLLVNEGPLTDLIADASDTDLAAGYNVLWIKHDPGETAEEFIAFQSVTRAGGVMTLTGCVRGCIDTTPTPHAAGLEVWFLSYGSVTLEINTATPPYVNVLTEVRFQAFNNKSEIDFNHTLIDFANASDPNRAELPYLPTAIKLNGASYPATISGELTVSWSHRNRLASWSYANAGATSEMEPDCDYHLRIYGETGSLLHEEIGITGTSYLYTAAHEIADNGLGRLCTHLHIEMRTAGSAERYSYDDFWWDVDRV